MKKEEEEEGGGRREEERRRRKGIFVIRSAIARTQHQHWLMLGLDPVTKSLCLLQHSYFTENFCLFFFVVVSISNKETHREEIKVTELHNGKRLKAQLGQASGWSAHLLICLQPHEVTSCRPQYTHSEKGAPQKSVCRTNGSRWLHEVNRSQTTCYKGWKLDDWKNVDCIIGLYAF